jgi:hypothetical protein
MSAYTRAKSGARDAGNNGLSPYLGEQQWSKIWNAALKETGIPFEPERVSCQAHSRGPG